MARMSDRSDSAFYPRPTFDGSGYALATTLGPGRFTAPEVKQQRDHSGRLKRPYPASFGLRKRADGTCFFSPPAPGRRHGTRTHTHEVEWWVCGARDRVVALKGVEYD